MHRFEFATIRSIFHIKAKLFFFLRTIKRAKSSDSPPVFSSQQYRKRSTVLLYRDGYSWPDRRIKDTSISRVIRSDKRFHCTSHLSLSALWSVFKGNVSHENEKRRYVRSRNILDELAITFKDTNAQYVCSTKINHKYKLDNSR